MASAATLSRLSVAARIAAAVFGGYGLAAAAVILLSAALVPLVGRVDAVWLGTMPGLFVYAGAIIAAFATRTALRAWGWLLGISAVFAAVRFLLLP